MSLLLGFVFFLIFLAIGIHVASVMFIFGVVGGFFALGKAVVLDFGLQVWTVLNSFVMTSIPLFLLLGEFLLRSRITDSLYKSLSLWLARLPGGLLHTNIGACAILAANSGSSVATAATIGTVAIPTFKAKGYNDRIVLGSIAAGGTLGILIPPSINMIVYGSIIDASIGRLFMGGVIPGLILAGLFSLVIVVVAIIRPSYMGIPEPKTSFMEKMRTLPAFLPPFFIIVAIMGSIYLGWATPTEAAALGVLAVFIVSIINKRVSLHMLHESFSSTVKTASMILLIMVAAFYLNYVISILGWPQKLTAWFLGFKLSPAATLWVIVIFYLILGCFIETLAMMITTIPLVVPVVTSIGYDPIWFGIFLVVLCEASLVTPPVGMNLYVVQGIRTDKGPMKDIIIGMLPFLVMMVVLLALLIYFPILALWLPGKMIG